MIGEDDVAALLATEREAAFVECLELQPIFPGKDIFVNPKYVGDDVFNLLEAGTAVRFQYTMDAGKPRATSCSWCRTVSPSLTGATGCVGRLAYWAATRLERSIGDVLSVVGVDRRRMAHPAIRKCHAYVGQRPLVF